MGAPKGNKNGLGNKGGGRKSLYYEKEAAEKVKELFNQGLTMTQLLALRDKVNHAVAVLKGTAKPQNITLSGFELYAYKVLTAKDNYLLNLINKVVGNKELVGEDPDNKFQNYGQFLSQLAKTAKNPPTSTIPEHPPKKRKPTRISKRCSKRGVLDKTSRNNKSRIRTPKGNRKSV